MDTLEKLLFELNSTVTGGEDSDSGGEAQNIVANIEAYVWASQLSDADVDYLLFILCSSNSPPSLLIFLNSTVRLKPFVKAKCSALKFLSTLVKFIGPSVSNYSIAILSSCIEQLRIEDSNEVKAACIMPIRQLFHLWKRDFVLDAAEVELENIYKVLMEVYNHKKATSTIQYEALVTLGHLIRIYHIHEATTAIVETVLDIAVSVLNRNFSVGKKSAKNTSPDLTSIAGAFSCLDMCITHFEERFQGNGDLWRQLMMALSGINQESVFRYAMVGKALRLIKNHATLFRDIIGINIATSYQLTVACFFSDKSACKKHAEEAILALLSEYSAFVCHSILSPESKSVSPTSGKMLAHIVADFLKYLDNAAVSSAKSIILSVKGLTVIAPAIAHVRPDEIGKINLVDKLISTCEYVLLKMEVRGQGDDGDESAGTSVILQHSAKMILRKAQFLTAIVTNISFKISEQHQGQIQNVRSISHEVFSYILGLASDIAIGYSRLWGMSQSAAKQSICLLFMSVSSVICYPFTSVLDEAMGQIVPCLFLRSISRMEHFENVELSAIDRSTGESDDRLHYIYSLLWKELLSPSELDTVRLLRSMSFQTPSASDAEPKQYSNVVVPVLINYILAETMKNVQAFDISYELSRSDGDDMNSSAPIPNNPADQELLLNLASMWEDIGPSLQCQLLLIAKNTIMSAGIRERLLHMLVSLLRCCSKRSEEWPMVSALYRLCSLFTSLCYQMSILCEVDGMASGGHLVEQFLCNYCEGVCRMVLNEFQHVELLNSAMRMLFDSPAPVLMSLPLKSHAIPLIVLSLQSGIQVRRCVSVVNALLDCNRLDDGHLGAILPSLEKYLQISSTKSTASEDDRHRRQVKKQVHTSSAVFNDSYDENDDMSGFDISIDILRLLGRLGGKNKLILERPEEVIFTSLSWACFENKLQVKLPVQFDGDSNSRSQGSSIITLALGSLLPRVVELCFGTKDIERQIIVNAAESLHAIVLVLIGQSVNDVANPSEGKQFTEMFETILPTILVLSVSTDVAIRNIFDGLVLQLIHWLSGPQTVHRSSSTHLTEMALVLLDGLLDGVGKVTGPSRPSLPSRSQSSYASYADMCNRMLVEMFRWLQKTTVDSSADSLVDDSSQSFLRLSADSLLNRLLVLSVHPCSEKRLGSANVLNNLYIFIREDSTLILKYILRILFSLMNSVKQVGSSQEACAFAVSKYLKIIVKFSENDAIDAALLRQGKWRSDASLVGIESKIGLFSYEYDQQQTSDQPSFPYTLRDLSQWMLSNISQSNYVFRRQCMMCLGEICPLLPIPVNSTSPPVVWPARPKHLQAIAEYMYFVDDQSSSTIDEVTSALASLVFFGLEHTLKDLNCYQRGRINADTEISDDLIGSPEMVTWLKSLNGALDCGNWIVRCVDPFSVKSFFIVDSASTESIPSAPSKRKRTDRNPATVSAKESTITSSRTLLFSSLQIFYKLLHRNLWDNGTSGREGTFLSSECVNILQELSAEIFRRSIQLLTSIADKSSDDFIEICVYYGLYSVNVGLSPILQTLLCASICQIPVCNVSAELLNTQAYFTSSSTEKMPPRPLSFTNIFVAHAGLHIYDKEGLSLGLDEKEEYTIHLPVAVEQFLMALTGKVPLLISDPWRSAMRCAIEELGPDSEILRVSSVLKTIAILRRCNLLSTVFSEEYVSVLQAHGIRFIESLLDRLAQNSSGDSVELSSSLIEVGSMLINLAVECGVSIGNEDASASLVRIALGSNGGIIFLKTFGSSLIEILIEEFEKEHLGECRLGFLDMLQNITERQLWKSKYEKQNFSILLRRILTSIVERMAGLQEKLLSSFVLKISNFAVSEGTRMQASGDCCDGVICNYDNAMLILHLDSFLFRRYSVKLDAAFNSFVLDNILDVFNSAGDHTTKIVSNPVLSGGKCDMIVRAMGMVPYFLMGTVSSSPRLFPQTGLVDDTSSGEREIVKKVTMALEEVVASKFPIRSTSLDLLSESGKEYCRIFKAWLNSFSACGSIDLLEPLMPSLNEGSDHIHFDWIKDSISTFVNGIDYSDPSEPGAVSMALIVCSRCIRIVLDSERDITVKLLFFDDICLSILRKCTPSSLSELSTSSRLSGFLQLQAKGSYECLLGQFMALIVDNVNVISQLDADCRNWTDDSEQLLLRILCSYTIVESLYDRCSVDEVKGHITKAYAGTQATGKELTQAICRSAHKLVRQVVPRQSDSIRYVSTPMIARILLLSKRVQSAAYNCLLLVVAKTQSEEQFYDNFVFKEKSNAPDQQFWCNVIDCTVSVDLEAQSVFKTIYLGGKFGPQESGVPKPDAVGHLPVRGLLSQYLLRSSSQLLSYSNVKKVFSESRPFSQSQSQHSVLTSINQLSNSSGSRLKENPKDTFATLTQSGADPNFSLSVLGREVICNDYELRDGEVQILGEPVRGLDDVRIALELNHINQQYCMGTLTRVIQRMHTLFQGRWSVCAQQGILPFWISVCREKLCDYTALPSRNPPQMRDYGDSVVDEVSHQRKNIRLFMMRLLMNQPVASIVAPFMSFGLLKAMIDCCLHDLCEWVNPDGNTARSKKNSPYMIRDFVFCIVDCWPRSFYTSRDEHADIFHVTSLSPHLETIEKSGGAFLSYLIQNVVTEHNLHDAAAVTDGVRSVCALIKLWVGGPPSKERGNIIRSGIDLTALVDFISAEEAQSGGAHAKASSRGSKNIRMRLAGLEILLCLLNTRYPIVHVADSKEQSWAQSLLLHACNGCKYPRKEVSVSSALVVGAFLSSIYSQDDSMSQSTRLINEACNYSIQVETKLNSIFPLKNGEDIVVGCVRAICQQYPSFLTRELLLKLFARFSSLAQKSRADFLEILCLCTAIVTSKFEGIVVMEHLKPYLCTLLNDASTVSVGRGSATKRIPITQILAIRLCSIHGTSCVALNIVPIIIFGSESGNSGGAGGIMKCVGEFSQLEIRQEAYKMLMALHDAITCAIENQLSEKNITKLKWQMGVVRILLLRGLTDPDDRGMANGNTVDPKEIGVRRMIFNFFEANFGLSSCPILRLKALMSELFDPIGSVFAAAEFDEYSEEMIFPLNVSDEWLRYCSYLLLSTCRTNDTVGLPCKLFPRGLAPDSSYKPMQIFLPREFGGSQSMSSTTPLFSIESTQPQFYGKDKKSRGHMFRGTQELTWTQTQIHENTSTFGDSDSLTGTPQPVNSASSVFGSSGGAISDQEKAFYTQFISSDPLNRSEFAKASGGMGPPSALPAYLSASSQKSDQSFSANGIGEKTLITQRVPLRFRKQSEDVQVDKGAQKSRVPFIYSTKRRQAQKATQERLKRNARITIFRNYRDGELPDICVPLIDLLSPLQHLVLLDSMMASLVFDDTFKAVYNVILDRGLGPRMGPGICNALCHMLGMDFGGDGGKNRKLGTLTSTTLVSSIFAAYRYCLRSATKMNQASHEEISLMPAELISSTAIASLNYHGGILLLEEQLLAKYQASSDEGEDANRFEQIWINLARLYSTLEEKDMIMGLLFQISRLHDTRKALDAEIRGDYPLAVTTYNRLLEASESVVRDESDSFDWDQMDDVLSSSISPSTPSKQEKQMWNERSLMCVRYLLDWDQLYEKVDALSSDKAEDEKSLGVIQRLLECDFQRKDISWLIPFYVHSISHIGGFTVTYDPAAAVVGSQGLHWEETSLFVQSISNAVDSRVARLKDMTEKNHPCDVAACFLSLGELSRAQAYASLTYSRFIDRWSALHPCASSARCSLLAGLQRVVELEDAISLLSTGWVQGKSKSEEVDAILKRWEGVKPSKSDPLLVWDDVGRIRSLGLMMFHNKYCDADERRNEYYDKVVDHLGKYHVDMAIAAVGQGMMQVVKTQLGVCNVLRRSLHQLSDSTSFLTMTEVATVYEYNKKCIDIAIRERHVADRSTLDICAKVIPMYEKTMALLNKKVEICQQESKFGVKSHLTAMLMQGEWLSSWANFTRNFEVGQSKWKAQMCQSFDVLNMVATVSKQNTCDSIKYSFDVSSIVHGSLVRHCDDMLDLLSTMEYGENEIFSGTSLSRTIIAATAIEGYISGLLAGDKLCRDRILRLFSLVGEHFVNEGGKVKTIIGKIFEIPPWVFLKYAAQIIGLIDRPEGLLAVAVLEHVACKYPKALYYPYNVTLPSLNSAGKHLVAKLHGLLRDELCDCFVEALGGLTHPELRWADGLKQVKELFRQKKAAEAETLYSELIIRCTDTEWPLVGTKIGGYNARFARFMSKRGGSVGEGKSSSRSSSQKSKEFTQKSVDDLLALAREYSGGMGGSWTLRYSGGKVPLSEFSEWLCDLGSLLLALSSKQFSLTSSSDSGFIEIPGQYFHDVDREPRTLEHSRILSVSSELLAISSIRKPKRLTLFGSGGEEYLFLVKGGEDLRNDERIEQLFILMNSIVRGSSNDSFLSSDNHAATETVDGKSKLRTRTFAVVPMSPNVGVLEWVRNTIPLKSIISDEMARDADFVSQNPRCMLPGRQGGVDLSNIIASEERLKWLKGMHDPASYHDMIRKAKSESAQKLWRKMTRTIPDDFLRRYFIRISSSPEIFLTLRSECAKSLSVSCIFGYILGIGDRHLDNLLLDVKGGSFVQIDFGICFGMGASVLPVPELIPFRLSPQLRALFQPLDGTNLLRHYMIESLTSLRSKHGREALKNALEVYVNDPVVDWLKVPLKKDELRELLNNVKWEPRRRVNNAVKKTEGHHPVQLLLEDLKLNIHVKQSSSYEPIQHMLWQSANLHLPPNTVLGNRRDSDLLILDPASQVDILINLATDPNLLVRHWVGLLMWI